jgi:phosphoribosylglycinamide formyltransferase 1
VRRVLFLASGGGGTFRLSAEAALLLGGFEVVGVIADRPCGALDSAARLGLVSVLAPYSRQQPTALRGAIAEVACDVVVTTIHKVLDAETLSATSAQFVNLHYALLPAFAGMIGMSTLAAARAANAPLIGATVHEVTAELDAGPILGQCAFAPDWSDQGRLEETMFRAAGLLLVDRLHGGGSRAPNRAAVCGGDVSFDPGLSFDASLFDEALWDRVRG